MTQNQIAYTRYLEEQRANKERERISQQEADTKARDQREKERQGRFNRAATVLKSITTPIVGLGKVLGL